jgi:hypothetical protein
MQRIVSRALAVPFAALAPQIRHAGTTTLSPEQEATLKKGAREAAKGTVQKLAEAMAGNEKADVKEAEAERQQEMADFKKQVAAARQAAAYAGKEHPEQRESFAYVEDTLKVKVNVPDDEGEDKQRTYSDNMANARGNNS